MALREQQARMKAEQALAQAQAESLVTGQVAVSQHSQEIVDIALMNEINKIRAMPTLADRIEYKRNQFIPHWLPFAEQHLTNEGQYQNDVIGFCIVYLFDVGNFDQALALAERAITNGQRLPEQFNRTIPHFVADTILAWTEKTAAMGQSVEPYFSQILDKVANVWNLHEIPTAKWLKQAAVLLIKTKDGKAHAASYFEPDRLVQAIQLCRKAWALNPKVGVKHIIERCEMRLTALAEKGITRTPTKEGASDLNAEMLDISSVIRLLKSPSLSLAEVIEQQRKRADCTENNREDDHDV